MVSAVLIHTKGLFRAHLRRRVVRVRRVLQVLLSRREVRLLRGLHLVLRRERAVDRVDLLPAPATPFRLRHERRIVSFRSTATCFRAVLNVL